MVKRTKAHYSFVAGETDPQYERRQDWEFWINSAERMRNVRLRNGGGWKRRPGLARVATLAGRGRFVPLTTTAGDLKLLILEPARYRVMIPAETFETTVTSGMVWAEGDLDTLQASAENNDVTITSTSFWPQVLTRSSAGSWSVGNLTFDVGGNLAKAQPYYRFPETKGIVLTPGANTGTGIALGASADVFVAGHVGARFRIFDREVEIATVSNGTTATCDIKQNLYPTLDISVASTTGFNVGDEVRTSVEEINAVVTDIVSGTALRVILTDSYSSPTTTSNDLIGPTAKSAISGVAAAGTPEGTVQWDEQLISSVRGYPSGNAYHRGRRCLFGFPQAPHVFCASAQDETDDFDVGDALDDDAIQSNLGDAIGRRIVHAVSTEQLILVTEVGPYYVGEGPGTPFTPTTIDFLDIGPEPGSNANPIKAAEGVVYADALVARLMVLAPTGNVRRSWETGDLSDLAPHMLEGITRLLLVDGCEWGPERYIMAINEDGDLAVMHYRRGQEVLGWTLWQTEGDFIDVCMFNNKVYAIVKRGASYYLERFDDDRLLDDSLLATGTSSITNTHWASREVEVVWRETVDGQARRASLGDYTANGSGVISGLAAESRDYEVGRSFDLTVRLWPPIDPDKPMNAAVRVSRVVADLVDSGHFMVNEDEVTPYEVEDDPEELPPLRTRQEVVALLGCERDATIEITQPVAAPLEVRALAVDAS